MLVDEVTIKVFGGKGGKGAVKFNKNALELGPTGGRGGDGGSVYFVGDSDLSLLYQFRFKKELRAGDGKDGGAQMMGGHAGEDLLIKVPIGTVVHNLDTGGTKEITQVGQKVMIAEGGKGGKGNMLFRSSKDTSPRRFQPGLPGESFALKIELKMIADVGLVGLPNAGKSTLLNYLTRAKSKVGNYQFTTLEPSIGSYYGLIMADIPGLIEGASAGKGLGTKFLRHIERTKKLFHLVSADSSDPIADYKAIRKELDIYGKGLSEKDEVVLLTKIDLVDQSDVKKIVSGFKRRKKIIFPISVEGDLGMDELKNVLNKLKDEKMKVVS